MTEKERMLRAVRGEWADRLPWVPRIDLWYNANSLRGTLPSRYRRDATLDEIADDIGGGYHKITPDFLQVPLSRGDHRPGDRDLSASGVSLPGGARGVEREV